VRSDRFALRIDQIPLGTVILDVLAFCLTARFDVFSLEIERVSGISHLAFAGRTLDRAQLVDAYLRPGGDHITTYRQRRPRFAASVVARALAILIRHEQVEAPAFSIDQICAVRFALRGLYRSALVGQS
jgi:hypothetical protein